MGGTTEAEGEEEGLTEDEEEEEEEDADGEGEGVGDSAEEEGVGSTATCPVPGIVQGSVMNGDTRAITSTATSPGTSSMRAKGPNRRLSRRSPCR